MSAHQHSDWVSKCSDINCPGWLIMKEDADHGAGFIQRCDECARFADDVEAMEFVKANVHRCEKCKKPFDEKKKPRAELCAALCVKCLGPIEEADYG